MYVTVSPWHRRFLLLIALLIYRTIMVSAPLSAQVINNRPEPSQVEVTFLLDCSGSMWSLHKDAKQLCCKYCMKFITVNRVPGCG